MESELFGPPASKPPSLWAAVCGVAASALVASLLHAGSLRAPSAAAREAPAPAPASRGSALARPLQDALSPVQQAPRLVVKCVHEGRVSYSDLSGCRGQATQLAFADARTPAVAPAAGYERSALGGTSARIDTLSAIDASDAGGPALLGPTAGQEMTACGILARDLATLDAAASSTLTPREQERVRLTRQRVRSQQTSVGC